ncbi:hypoxanthine guanine phosphoribosyltransferase [Echinococcus multilocularis]|uniref:Hypoxanthine phosphoribosyltransferase n=1 Tax=Echinococcus multilocularis TaxID=6211 RepID=A0A068YCV1_ECHMU|nr:hypoxanthine guanine phosphoribosyltransferase [Echinococcus multilocularis]
MGFKSMARFFSRWSLFRLACHLPCLALLCLSLLHVFPTAIKMESQPMNRSTSVVVIPDNYQAYEISQFCVSPKYRDYLERLMIPNGLIKDRIEKVASEIVEHYEKQKVQHIIAICVLKGGFKFCVDLIDAMERTICARGTLIPISTDFVRIRSYLNTSSTDSITLTGVDDPSIYEGKDILIVEDIVDSGKTMCRLNKYLSTLHAKSVTDACLLVKRTSRSSGYRPCFAGFEIPDHFVVGYALDYNEYFRDLHHICVLNKVGLEYFAVPEEAVNHAAEESKPST